jgi:hypothetical protein
MLPDVSVSRQANVISKVLLPQPLGPMITGPRNVKFTFISWHPTITMVPSPVFTLTISTARTPIQAASERGLLVHATFATEPPQA